AGLAAGGRARARGAANSTGPHHASADRQPPPAGRGHPTAGAHVVLRRYGRTTSYFPLRFRRGVAWRPPWDIEEDPNDVDLEPWTPIAEYVFTWRLRPDAPVYAALAPRYALVWSDANARIYRRRE